MSNKIKECEQLMIDYAKEKNYAPGEMLSNFQTALLNIAGWVCDCFGYTKDQKEKFMTDYADNVRFAVKNVFIKEE